MRVVGPDIDKYTKNKKVGYAENTLSKIGKNILWSLKTPIGSRPNLPEFGSKLPWLIFDLVDGKFFGLAKLFIVECISKCEPRAIIKSIDNITDNTDYRNRKISIKIEFEVADVVGRGTVVVDYVM